MRVASCDVDEDIQLPIDGTVDSGLPSSSLIQQHHDMHSIDPGTPSINPDDTIFCEIDQPDPTINYLDEDLITNGGITTWYDSFPNGNALSLNDFLVDGESYYVI